MVCDERTVPLSSSRACTSVTPGGTTERRNSAIELPAWWLKSRPAKWDSPPPEAANRADTLFFRSQADGLQRYLIGCATASAPPSEILAVQVGRFGLSR